MTPEEKLYTLIQRAVKPPPEGGGFTARWIRTQRDIIRERIQARQQERQALREEQQKKPQQIHAPQQPPQPQEKEMER